MSALRLFTKTNSKKRWNIASWHSMHSLTWLWILSFNLFGEGEGRVFPILWWYRGNNGLQWFVRIPWVGMIYWQKQRPMWWRDLYLRAQRDGRLADDPIDAKVIAAMAWEKGFQAGVERSHSATH